jgi:hypothetical protein
MTGNKLTIKLTGEQQKQILDATGKAIAELNIDLGATGGLSEGELDQVAGGVSSGKHFPEVMIELQTPPTTPPTTK